MGLEREEVAQSAGVDVACYPLGQSRPVHFSASVLEAVVGALQLDDVDRAHLHDLAGPRDRRGHGDPAGRPVVAAGLRARRARRDERDGLRHRLAPRRSAGHPLALGSYLDTG